MNTIATWSNTDNADFYNIGPAEFLPEHASKGGLDTGCDLDVINDYISAAKTILEVGAGRGRVIRNLLAKNYQGKIVALERSQRSCQLLKSEFSNNNQIDIINADIQSIQLKNDFDLVLWLWTGFAEFAKTEQLAALKLLFSHVKPQGHLIIDLVPTTIIPLNTQHHDKQNWSLNIKKESADPECHFYVPTHTEMLNYANALQVDSIEHIDYTTSTNRPRILYLFKKGN